MLEKMLERDLRFSDRGQDVLELQRMLVGWGSKREPVVLDEEFGPATEHALRRFQHEHDLEPDGTAGELTMRAMHDETQKHPVCIEEYKCTCGECNGFGSSRFEHEYMPGKPQIEAYYMFEYPGIDLTLVWALCALMHRAAVPKIHITSGYRCWTHNEQHGRTSTNHMGKAVDFISIGAGSHNRSVEKRIECTECARVRRIGIEECGYQAGWTLPDRVSLEMPYHGAYTWVHIDTRCIPRNKRKHVQAVKYIGML